MRPIRLITATAVATGVLGCTSSPPIHTISAPQEITAQWTTFRVLPVPPARDGRTRQGAYDPMVNNSIANRALRATITRGFSDRGYVMNEQAPDFEVAVYATARERLDVAAWDYGYPFWPRRAPWAWPQHHVVTEYSEGTVIVDVVRALDRELVWRGSASARLSENPSKDVRTLQDGAADIVK